MSFSADKQTLEDLNLLGKFKQDSVYSLFNRVFTKSGEALLQEMFKSPLSEPEAINRRSLLFRYFQGQDIRFPFSGGELELMEEYLSNTKSNNHVLIYADLLIKKGLRFSIHDEKYDILVSGLLHTTVILNIGKDFLEQFDDSPENPFQDEILTAKNILKDQRLAWLDKSSSENQWTLFKIAGYHLVLTSVMREELGVLMDILSRLDVYLAVSRLAREQGFAYAHALPRQQNMLQAKDLRHPRIEKGIGNGVSFSSESNLLFLTGANMAGKSTLMKSVGITLYLAHMGFPVAVQEMEFSIKDGIYTSINVADSLNQGYSHFYAEVLRVKTVAEQVSSGKSLFVIFDELFKGTNVKDAYDATLEVTAAFSAYRNCFFIISTHIIEVGETLQPEYGNMQFSYMPTTMQGTVPIYTYKAQQGISSDRHGMIIIKNEGILDLMHAKKKVKNL
jgi:DNA mismatch repair protein MutS